MYRHHLLWTLLTCVAFANGACGDDDDGAPPAAAGTSAAGSNQGGASNTGGTSANDAGAGGDAPSACYKLPESIAPYEPDYSGIRPDTTGACRMQNAQFQTGLLGSCGARCAAATFEATSDCDGDPACIDQALAEDATASTAITSDIDFGDGPIEQLDCSTCITLQNLSCQYVICPDESAAADDCFASLQPGEVYEVKCAVEVMELDTCFYANTDDFFRCTEVREGACFGNSLTMEQ